MDECYHGFVIRKQCGTLPPSAVVGGTGTQRIGFSGAYHDSTNNQW
jgi:hypothetical protein